MGPDGFLDSEEQMTIVIVTVSLCVPAVTGTRVRAHRTVDVYNKSLQYCYTPIHIFYVTPVWCL